MVTKNKRTDTDNVKGMAEKVLKKYGKAMLKEYKKNPNSSGFCK